MLNLLTRRECRRAPGRHHISPGQVVKEQMLRTGAVGSSDGKWASLQVVLPGKACAVSLESLGPGDSASWNVCCGHTHTCVQRPAATRVRAHRQQEQRVDTTRWPSREPFGSVTEQLWRSRCRGCKRGVYLPSHFLKCIGHQDV